MKLFSKKKKGVELLISRCKQYKSFMEFNHKHGSYDMEDWWRTRYIICKISLEQDFGVNVDEL